MSSEDSSKESARKETEPIPVEAMKPIRTIYIAPHDFPLMAELLKKAKKEGWSFSRLVFEALYFYAAKHSKDNSQFQIEHWVKTPSFLALPTLGETPTPESLSEMPEQDIKLLATRVRHWVTLLNPLIRELDWKWRWLQRDE